MAKTKHQSDYRKLCDKQLVPALLEVMSCWDMTNEQTGRDQRAYRRAKEALAAYEKLQEAHENPSVGVWRMRIEDYFPPSPNTYRMKHWTHVRKHVVKARERLYVECLAAGGVPQFEDRVQVTITRWWGKRQREWDIDNLYGAVKPLIDAMRKESQAGIGRQGGLGIIQEDNPNMIDLRVVQARNTERDTQDCEILITGRRVR